MKRLVLCLALFLAACTGTSPEPDYYELTAINGTPAPGLALSIKIQRPSLPEYLDRPYIVREENAYQYTIDDMQWWAEPLGQMFERILTEDLRQRLPGSTILSEDDTGTVNLRYAVETEIQRFNAVDQKKAALDAIFFVTDKTDNQSTKPQPVRISVPVNGSADALAAALSQLVAAYADRIETALQQQSASHSNP